MGERRTPGYAAGPAHLKGRADGNRTGPAGSEPPGPAAVSLRPADQIGQAARGLSLHWTGDQAWHGSNDLPPSGYPEAARDGTTATGATGGEAGGGGLWPSGVIGSSQPPQLKQYRLPHCWDLQAVSRQSGLPRGGGTDAGGGGPRYEISHRKTVGLPHAGEPAPAGDLAE